ncbi:MAG TPA: LysR family transcriptional regulator [Burkholderiales bacterium]|nr:LysR family transcriptional regulator [Burkholderiales bacterium]
MDKLAAMGTFAAIVDRGSLTAAADALNASLPTVVRTLAALEKELGVRLLNRTTRRIALTEEGRYYLERCRRVLAEIDEAELGLSAQQKEPSGTLSVTASVMFGRMHLAPAVTAFLKQFPATRVEMLLLDRVVSLVEEGIDVGVRIGALSDSSLIAIPVGKVRRIVCASPALLKRVGTPKHPKELASLDCIGFTGLANGPQWSFVENGRTVAVPAKTVLTCNQAYASMDACAAGLGFGVFLSYMIRPLEREKQLKVVLAEFEPPALPVNVVYPHGRLVSTRVRAFLDSLAKQLPKALAD